MITTGTTLLNVKARLFRGFSDPSRLKILEALRAGELTVAEIVERFKVSEATTSNVTIRNNFIYDNTDAGISMGGYDTQRGSTENCVIVNNTLYNNARLSDAWGAELYVQYDTRYNIIKNNIFYAASSKPYILSWSTVMTGNVMDYNLFFNGASWQWQNVTYTSFSAYQSGSGNDTHSLNGVNPLLVNPGSGDLHLQSNSPAIDAGQTLTQSGSYDIDGQPRVQGAAIDLGADEVR